LGRMTADSCPDTQRYFGNAPTTSPSPPAFATG